MMKPVLLDIQGDPHARGRALGFARRRRIQSCLSAWLESVKVAGIADPHSYLTDMLEATDFLPAIRRHAPDLLEEVRGLAVGAGQPFELVYAAQLLDEEWAYRKTRLGDSPPPQKCSSVAAKSADGAMLIGQNMDLGGYTEGHQTLLELAPHGAHPGALIFSVSSMIALLGINTHRIGVCVNSIPQLPAAREGLPVAFVIRTLLQSRTLEEAIATMRKLPHATGQHYLIADSARFRSFEASPAGVVEYHPPEADRIFHTNHPLADSLKAVGGNDNSVGRLQCLRRRLASGQPSLESVKAALSSRDDPEHPVSRTKVLAAGSPDAARGLTNFTTGSMISVLRGPGEPLECWVSAGPPSLQGYTRALLEPRTDRTSS
jgi:isopenicillin-N N-acyltransferase like protein